MTTVLEFFTNKPLCLIIILFLFSIPINIYIFKTYDKNFKKPLPKLSENSQFRNETKKPVKNILFWNSFWNQKDFFWGMGSTPFENCSKPCFVTNNRTMLPITEYDAVIFHAVAHSRWTAPQERSPKQKYIFYSMETPISLSQVCINNFFNWTMSYREDSDIRMLHGLVQKQKTNYSYENNIFENKTKSIIWFVSNCGSKRTKVREDYTKELKKYIDVDIYGRCGSMSCTPPRSEKCYNMMVKNYKFYLSFENSICKDYVTEKLFNVLRYDIIPIVLGGAKYETVAPPHSFINAMDFKTPKDLAEYLLKIGNDKEEYLKYFKWKKDYVIIHHLEKTRCTVCEMLHQPIVYSNYDKMEEWVNGKNGSICQMPWNNENKLIARYENINCRINVV